MKEVKPGRRLEGIYVERAGALAVTAGTSPGRPGRSSLGRGRAASAPALGSDWLDAFEGPGESTTSESTLDRGRVPTKEAQEVGRSKRGPSEAFTWRSV